jgi:hypothetical protein
MRSKLKNEEGELTTDYTDFTDLMKKGWSPPVKEFTRNNSGNAKKETPSPSVCEICVICG